MTHYKKCPYCGAVRMLYQVIDGEHVRTCFKCFKIQRRVTVPAARAKAAALNLALICSLVAGPVGAEQVVLDGQEFRVHVARDKQIQADRDNLEQQVGLYKQNETNYQAVIQRLKALQAKTDEKAAAQDGLLATYEQQRVQLVAQQQELAEEVRAVKREKDKLTWTERGKGLAAGLLTTMAVAVYLLRGGR